LIARGIVGAGIGVTAVVCPMYVSENAEPSRRGFMGVLFQLAITFGIFIANLIGWGLSASSLDLTLTWRLMLGIGVISPAALLVETIMYMKEPKRLDQSEVDTMNNINQTLDEWNEKNASSASSYTLINGFILETVLACILQLTGINAVMYYGPNIIAKAGKVFAQNQNLLNIGIGFFNFVFTIFAVIFVERLGRRPLMILGTATMSVALFILGIVYIPQLNARISEGNLGIAVGINLIAFLFGFEIGPGCLFWVLVNENFPKEHPKYKEAAATYANVLQWVLNLVVSLVFPSVADYPMPTFIFFGSVGIISTVYLVLVMKETRN